VVNRRSFLKRLSVAGATSAVPPTGALFLADGKTQAEEGSGNLSAGDAAVLRFAAAGLIGPFITHYAAGSYDPVNAIFSRFYRYPIT
jgi:hypothetical protein